MTTQRNIKQALGISQTMASFLLSGKRCVSWPIAAKLNTIFPAMSVPDWKEATPDQIKKAFIDFNNNNPKTQKELAKSIEDNHIDEDERRRCTLNRLDCTEHPTATATVSKCKLAVINQ